MKKIISLIIIAMAMATIIAKPKIKSFSEKEYGIKYTMEYIGGNIWYEIIKYEGQYEEDYLNCWRSFGYEIEEVSKVEGNISSLIMLMLTEFGIPKEAHNAIYNDRILKYGIQDSGIKYGDKLIYFVQRLEDAGDEKWLRVVKDGYVMKICNITECKENIGKYTAKNLKLKDVTNYSRK